LLASSINALAIAIRFREAFFVLFCTRKASLASSVVKRLSLNTSIMLLLIVIFGELLSGADTQNKVDCSISEICK